MKKLNIDGESFNIIPIPNYGPNVHMSYDWNDDTWKIYYEGIDDWSVIHKIAYVSLFKRAHILERFKKNTERNQKKIDPSTRDAFCSICDQVINKYLFTIDPAYMRDCISHYIKVFLNKVFKNLGKKVSVNYKIEFYITQYLRYFYLLPEVHRRDYKNKILCELHARIKEIVETPTISRKTIRNINKQLRTFHSIIGTFDISKIINYVIAVYQNMPCFSKNYLIQQFELQFG